MNTQEILLLILTSVGMGVIASVLVYLILAQKYKHTNNKMQTAKQGCEFQLEERHKQVENAKAEIAAPFPLEAELDEKCKRLAELNAELNMDRRENEIVDGVDEQSEDERDENNRTRSDRNDR